MKMFKEMRGNNQWMEMDTSVHVACSMTQEWEAAALGDQSDTRTIGAPWARSGDGKYPDRNIKPV